METEEARRLIKEIHDLVWNEAIDKCIAVADYPDAKERMEALKNDV